MAAPVNSILPAITGAAAVGSSLSLSDGTWNNVPTSYAYAWLRAGVVIAGEVLNAYTVTLADLLDAITGRVTATNADGSTPATSAATGAVPTTLIPETGAASATADTYSDLTQADSYHAARGNAAWAALTAANKEAALRKATDYLEQSYRMRWAGWRMSTAQALSWPRAWVPLVDTPYAWVSYYAQNVIPAQLVNACAELALRAAAADLAPDLKIRKDRVVIGPITTEFNRYSPQFVRYRAIDNMLAPFVSAQSGGPSVRMERA